MIGYRAPEPREVVVSRSKLEALRADHPDVAVIVTPASRYLVLDGIAYVAALRSAS